MNDATARVEADRRVLAEAQQQGRLATLGAYVRLSGPGWLQSAITLGGGSLASSLIMGVLAGFTFLWVQPVFMILGIVMLSAIAYVAMSTRQRPFAAIKQHVSPVLAWAWLLAALAANMFWCMPQYALATNVLQENLLPGVFGPAGTVNQVFGGTDGGGWLAQNASTLVIVGVILLLSTSITWAYDSGNWGIRAYELTLKLMVGGIVLCFFAVIFAIRQELDWGGIFAGFIPRLDLLTQPAPAFREILQHTQYAGFWTAELVSQQHDVIISAAATAVGINMTFLFPYSILAKGWTREFRGLTVFDLSTGMLIPFTLATSCVVVAAASQMHARPVAGFVSEADGSGTTIVPDNKAKLNYYGTLRRLLIQVEGESQLTGSTMPLLENEALLARLDELPETDRRVAAMLVERNAFDLARALAPLAGQGVANVVFGLGVLGMALSTITLLMLISGFCVCEALGLPCTGWPHRLGALAAATGVLGPFVWSKAYFYLAVYVSSFGMMLLPIAYVTFFVLMNKPKLLGSDMPRGARRWCWNSLMAVATTVATFASLYTIHKRLGWYGIMVMVLFVAVALSWRWIRPQAAANSE